MSPILQQNTKGSAGKTDLDQQEVSYIYAEINKEVATLLAGDDMIIFGPAEDFEYTAPLEDFKKTQKAEN
jgi:hypothetical protein